MRANTLTLAAAITSCLIALPACGGTAPGESDESAAAAVNGADSALIQEAQAAITAAAEPLTFTPPGPAIDASLAEGKTVHVVAVDLAVPALAAVNDHLAEVADELGVTVTVANAESQVNKMQQGLRQGIDQKADGIVLLGVPADLVRPALNEAQEGGIAVVNVLNSQPDPGAEGQGAGPGFFATVAPDYRLGGQLAAYKAVLDTNGTAEAVLIDSKGLQPAPSVAGGIKEVLEKCEGCSLEEKDVPLAQWGVDITPLVVSTIRSNPELDYVLPIFDGMGIFAAAGVQQAGSSGKVKVASFNGSAAALALVKQGDVFTADPGQSNEWAAWATMDQVIRGILGEAPADPVLPVRYLDTQAMADMEAEDERAVYGDDFVDGYRQLWGLR